MVAKCVHRLSLDWLVYWRTFLSNQSPWMIVLFWIRTVGLSDKCTSQPTLPTTQNRFSKEMNAEVAKTRMPMRRALKKVCKQLGQHRPP